MIIREAKIEDAAAIAKVHVNSWRTTYQGIVPDHYLAGLSYERSELMWRDILSNSQPINFTVVAEDNQGNVIGFANGGREREGNPTYTGEVFAIYILEEFQRKGIGSQLMVALVSRLIQAGLNSLLVWVLEENPARRFYETLGGKLVSQKSLNIGGANLTIVSYGWKDAHEIIENALGFLSSPKENLQ